MKKLYFVYMLMIASFVACDFAMPRMLSSDAADSIFIRRYDRVEARYLTTGDFAALQEMNTVYPTETRALIEDILKLGVVSDPGINNRLLSFYQDSTLQNLVHAAEAEFGDMSDIENGLRNAFVQLRREVPELVLPEFYAQITSFDQSIVVDDNRIGISLDKYLGSDYPTYERFYEKSQRATMTRQHIVSDCVMFYLISRYGLPNFDSRSQAERDGHFAILSWVTMKVTGCNSLTTANTRKVDEYMQLHPDVTIPQLLSMVTVP